MTASALRTLVWVHGAVAWVALATLAGALLAAWRRPAWRGRAALWAGLSGAAAFATGWLLHGPFQRHLRQRLFLASSTLGWLFERKEHAAFGAVALCGGGLFGLLAGHLAAREGDDDAAVIWRRAAVVALGAALAFEGFAIVVSIAAARRVGF